MPDADQDAKRESPAAIPAPAEGPSQPAASAFAPATVDSPGLQGAAAGAGAVKAEKQQKKPKQQKPAKPEGQGDQHEHQGQPRPPKAQKQQKAQGEPAAAGADATASKPTAAPADHEAKEAKEAKEPEPKKDAEPAAPTGLAEKIKAEFLGPILQKVAMAKEIYGLPWVTIATGREPTGREIYQFLSSNHLTWPFIPKKCLGVALLKLPTDHAGYLAGKSRQALRTNITRTKKAGFTCRMFDPVERFAQILAIYRSTPERQGHAVDFQAGPFAQMMADRPERFYGIFDKDDVLKGFACPTITGEMGWTRVFIGHNDDLRTGIMYALMSYLIQELIAERDRRGQPLWLMYDFWYGKSEGMRYFIQLCGFTPYNVHWRQAHIAPERRAPTDDWQRWECG